MIIAKIPEMHRVRLFGINENTQPVEVERPTDYTPDLVDIDASVVSPHTSAIKPTRRSTRKSVGKK